MSDRDNPDGAARLETTVEDRVRDLAAQVLPTFDADLGIILAWRKTAAAMCPGTHWRDVGMAWCHDLAERLVDANRLHEQTTKTHVAAVDLLTRTVADLRNRIAELEAAAEAAAAAAPVIEAPAAGEEQ